MKTTVLALSLTAMAFLFSSCTLVLTAQRDPMAAMSTPDHCFSPNAGCDQKLADFVATAKKTLDIAIYDINLANVTKAIVDAQNRGVRVRMVVDKRQSTEKNSTVAQLSKVVPVRFGKQAGTGIMHNKFTLVDNESLETGSFNYTNHATAWNHENQFYTDDPRTVAAYHQYFETLWANGIPIVNAGHRPGGP